mgnify:CR=1 FL=1
MLARFPCVYWNKLESISFWISLSCTLNGAVPEPGRLLQQPYKASIGVTLELAACSPSKNALCIWQWKTQKTRIVSLVFYLHRGRPMFDVLSAHVWRGYRWNQSISEIHWRLHTWGAHTTRSCRHREPVERHQTHITQLQQSQLYGKCNILLDQSCR